MKIPGWPGRKRTAPAAAGDGSAERLLASGLFDRECYEAQQDATFADDLAAARDFVQRVQQRPTPHPLVDLLTLPAEVRDALRGGDVDALLAHAGRPGAAVSPLFDGAEEALPDWLAHAVDATPLPGRPSLTWAEARRALLAHHREVGEWRRSRRKRTTRHWDVEAEQDWREHWRAHPLPEDTTVSVVMPVHNRAQTVGTAIASLRAQTLATWELLAVDDGSTDGSLEMLEEFASVDPRIRPIAQPWSGVCAARNRGLAAATGRYVAFLDSDNEWDPEFLQLAVTAMAAHGLGAVHAVVAKRDGEGRRYLAHQGDLQDLLVANHIDLNGLVVTREVADATPGFDPQLRRWVDHDFAIEVARRTEIILLPFIGVDYEDATDATDRITTTESDGWQFAVLGKHWSARVRSEQGTTRQAGLTSVVIDHEGDPRRLLSTVATLLDEADVEVLVVDNGSRRDLAAHAFATLLGVPNTHYTRLPRTLRDAGARDVGLHLCRGETVVFLDGDVRPRPGWLPLLRRALADPEVALAAPLVQDKDDAVSAAGLLLSPDGPVRHLAGHPPEDADRLEVREFSALPMDCLAGRATDLMASGGFDPVFTGDFASADLSLRMAGRKVLVCGSRVNRREPVPEAHRDKEFARRWPDLPTEQSAIDRAATGARWGLKIASVGGPRGDRWGDTHFADALAAALTDLGQQVGSYRHLAHDRPTRALDDVSLVLRGLDRVEAVPGKVNVLWVISHPEDVDPAETDGFDLVYAASESWAAEFARRTARPVGFLPQATDLRRLADPATPVGDGTRPVFVGGIHEGRTRPLVFAALEAGLPLTVHGPGWRGVVPEANLGREYVPNEELSSVYRAAGLVLNDHWPDMSAHGFVSNRVYDAVAAGARVITDPVAGLEAFDGAVRVAATPAEISALWHDRTAWPDAGSMAAIAARVAGEHSFARRARQLLDDIGTRALG